MSNLTDPADDTRMGSVDDGDFEQTDVDSAISDHKFDEDSPQDYWFGRKYFECVLAQNILQKSRLSESVAQIDSRLESAIQKFPYAHSLTELRAQGLEPLLPSFQPDLEHDAYRIMMFCIGAIVRKGKHQEKATLRDVLRRDGTTSEASDFPRPRNGQARGEGSARGYPPKIEQFVDEVNSASSDLGQYATALKEHCDKRGLTVTYKVDELSKVPPRYRAFVVVDELPTYEGTAKTKKQARHEAAKEACLNMNIEA